MFGSVDEVDPIESEPKPKDEKPQPKVPNGALPNCTSSPDSGHPSSRNFSVTSGLSDCSPSTEDASTQENGTKVKLPEQSAVSSEVTLDLATNSSVEDKLKEESAEQSSLVHGTGKGDLIKSPTGALPPEAEMINAQENEKVENSDAKEVEKSELNVSETAESTISEHSEHNAKPSDSNEKSKQILQSPEDIAEETTKSLEEMRDSQMLVEPEINTEFINDSQDNSKENIPLLMQAKKGTPTMCDPHRALTKVCSVEEAKNNDTSPSVNAEELIKSEMTSAPHMESLEKETQPIQSLTESDITSAPHLDPLEKESKSLQCFAESEMTSSPVVEPSEKEMKPPQPFSEMTSAPYTEPLEKETQLPQTLSETEMTSAPDMDPLQKTEIKPPQSLFKSEKTSNSHVEPSEKETKSPQPLSESERTNDPHHEALEKTQLPQPLSETEITSVSEKEPMEKENKPPQPLFESDMSSTRDMEPLEETEIKPPQPLCESEMTSSSYVEPSEKETKSPQPFSESEDIELVMSNPYNADKSDMKSKLNWPCDSSRTKALLKQLNEPMRESCISIMSLSKQSPDTSDDSPSALEMEEIPAALVYMPSEDILASVPITLGPPLALTMPPEKSAVGMPALELCTEADQNTSPEATESVLSEEEPEIDSLFPKPDSLAVEDHKTDVASPVSSIGTTYSVS